MSCVNCHELIHNEYGHCIEISNGIVGLIITLDVGPRVIKYGFTGKDNMLCETSKLVVDFIDDRKWKLYGGHRLWHAPENHPRNYVPDDEPVEWIEVENGVKISQKVEPWVQIKKDMKIQLSTNSTIVTLDHQLTNRNAWPIEVAVWVSTVMDAGGMEIIPQSSRDTGVECNRMISLWAFSEMDDSRVYWGKKYILLKQKKESLKPFKLGMSNEEGWAAYVNKGNMFVKRFFPRIGEKYPDYGSSFETYTNEFMLEMETLSPLQLVNPKQSIEHRETWELLSNVATPAMNEAEIEALVRTLGV